MSNSAALWTVARQAPLSVEFCRQKYQSGLPFPSPGDLPHPGIEPAPPAWQADSLPLSPQETFFSVVKGVGQPIAGKAQEDSRRQGWLGRAGRQRTFLRRKPPCHFLEGARVGGGVLSPWTVAVTTSICSLPAHLLPPPRPALCNHPAARACPASSSCLDQSSRCGAVNQRLAVSIALGWGWSWSSHNTGISPRARGGGFLGFCPRELRLHGPDPRGHTDAPRAGSKDLRRAVDREEGK